MAGWSKQLTSMELDDEEKFDAPQPIKMSSKPDFPYGLRVCLSEKELTKLGLGADCDVGDGIRLRAFGKVTSVSTNDYGKGTESRVEIQIERLAVEPDEDEDD